MYRYPVLDCRPELVIPYDPFQGLNLTVGHQYEYDPLDDDGLSKMYMVRYKDWKRASFFRQRLILQELLTTFLGEGFISVQFQNDELLVDLNKLWNIDPWGKFIRRDMFWVDGGIYPGRKLLEQFTSWGKTSDRSFKQLWREPVMMFAAMRRCLHVRKDLTRHNIMCSLAYKCKKPARFVCPLLYRSILQRFEIKNQLIADPYSDFGSKAMAAMMEDCYYAGVNDLDALGDFLGTRFERLSDRHYDVILLDFGFEDPGGSMIEDGFKQWSDRADILLVYVPERLRGKMPKPAISLKVRTMVKPREIGYLYCYR